MASLEFRGLTKRFGAVTAVDDLSVNVRHGSVTGFLGPNGAGKTTTLRMLLGLVTPTAGTATIDGQPYRALARPREVAGAVLESSGAYPGRTAAAHLRIEALVAGAPRSRVDEVLDLVGLADAAGRRVGGFSLGMRQRLSLATALLCDPEVLILDEPANGLDPEGVRWLRQMLRDLAGEGRTVLVSSHILAEVAQTADRVIIIDRGRLVAEASLAELTASAQGPIRVRTPRAEQLRDVLATQGATARLVASDRLEVTGITSERLGTLAAEQAIPLFETTVAEAGLEEVFLRLTAGTGAQEVVR